MDDVLVRVGKVEVTVEEHDRRIRDNKDFSKESRKMITNNSEKINGLAYSQIEHQTKTETDMSYVKRSLSNISKIGIAIIIGLVMLFLKEAIFNLPVT